MTTVLAIKGGLVLVSSRTARLHVVDLHACIAVTNYRGSCKSKAPPPAGTWAYLLLPLQLLNLNEPIRVAQLKLPVVA